MPAVLGFVVLFILFSITANDANFLSTRNFANLLTQAAPITLIGVGLVFVLLLGEIDLSAGATAGVCAVSMAWLLDNGYSPWIAAAGGHRDRHGHRRAHRLARGAGWASRRSS